MGGGATAAATARPGAVTRLSVALRAGEAAPKSPSLGPGVTPGAKPGARGPGPGSGASGPRVEPGDPRRGNLIVGVYSIGPNRVYYVGPDRRPRVEART